MSGRTIGTIAGAAIGFVVSGFNPYGAYWGATLGGLAGAAISPDHIQGVQLDDLPIQTSVSGNARAIVLGTSPVKGTRIICESEARIVEEQEDVGKGSGTVVDNDVAYQDFTIEVCESSELRGTSVSGILAVWEDGILVYDVRENPLIPAADSAKWKQGVTFYYGAEDQLTDPTEESIYGVGNVPAYRGTCRMVFANRKISPRNSISAYEVLVSRCAVEIPESSNNYLLVTGQSKIGDTSVWAAALATDPLVFVGLDVGTGADLALGLPAYNSGAWVVAHTDDARISTDGRATWQTIPLDSNTQPVTGIVGGDAGWFINAGDSFYPEMAQSDQPPTSFVNYSPTATGTNGTHVWQVDNSANIFRAGDYYFACFDRNLFRATSPNGPWTTLHDQFSIVAAGLNPNGACNFNYRDAVKIDGKTYFALSHEFSLVDRRTRVIWSPDDGVTIPDANIVYDGLASADPSVNQLVAAGGYVVGYCGTSVLTSADGFSVAHATGLSYDGSDGRKIAAVGDYAYIIGTGVTSGDKCVVFDPAAQTFSSPVTMPIASAVGIAADSPYFGDMDEIPDAPGYYINPITGAQSGPSIGEGTSCGTTLDEITSLVTRLCDIPDDEVFVSELEAIAVRGITIQSLESGKAILEPVQQTWLFDLPEFDGKLRAHLRGQVATDVAIDVADLLDTGDEEEDWRRGQMVTYPRKHHLGYMSLDLDYVVTDAPAARTSPDVRVVGETHIGSVGVHTDEEAMQIADKQLKVAWTEREGLRKFALPLEYLRIVGASIVTLENRRWRIDSYRIDNMAIFIEAAVYDRASAYTSNAEGRDLTGPTAPPTSIKGPTDSVILNVPVLDDRNDNAGLIWAPRGYPDTAWTGAVLQIQRDGVWSNVADTTRACNTGTLLSDLPAYDGTVDETNTLHIRLSGGIDSITLTQFLSEGNPLAIQYPDGTAEIVQAQYATEISADVYECTRLIRGRLDTVNGEHLAGAKVVFLNTDLKFVPVRADDIGKTLSFRAVSNGTDPAAAVVQTITLTTIESLREWQPYNIEIESDGASGYCISWIGRARLGSDLFPVHSQWFDGYSVRLTDGVVIHDIETEEQSVCVTAAEMTAIFGGGYGQPDVSVVAKSTSSQQAYNPAAPTGWVAESGTWTEDPAGQYNMLPTGEQYGRLYRESLYPFTSGTFDASVDKYVVGGVAFITVDFINASGITFLTENGNSDGPTSSLTMTAASLAPFGTVANARVHLRVVLSPPPSPIPVTFSSLNVVVTP